MLILGLESATAEVGCAIGGHEGVLASSHSARGKRHAENLTPAIEFVCRQARVELSEISCVAVDNGPGLFTGLRVGVASGKAIAQALRVPMISVSSLDLLAFPLRFTDRRIATVIDARRNEVFWAFYRQVPGGIQRISEPAVGGADDLAAELQAQPGDTLLAGDGAVRYAEALTLRPGIEVAGGDHAYPSARSLVQLAHAKALREDWVRPEQIELLYLRKPDAEINWSVREGA
ncbi:MAG TPA: tRNA (adenosine(37)-N6)-threonylcarbamoyltransferase complex dimerization subunit type 1 TsaB [Acidimicrobiales bacterium]|nr:tRNA (adenosine(37)-N6)-threonylcarbamoyltransferase complex dimerization subunit type 1 TsaB [Acidimicrobiales bacterium]